MSDATPDTQPNPFTLEYKVLHMPDRLAMRHGAVQRTWAEHAERICRAGHALRTLGVEGGQRMAILLHNGIPWWEVASAAGKVKANSVPIGYRLKAPEVEYIINNSESSTVVYGGEFTELIADIRERCPQVPAARWICVGGEPLPGGTDYEAALAAAATSDPEVDTETTTSSIIYTSGTTGRPKGAFRKPRPRSNDFAGNAILAFNVTPGGAHLVCCPLYHSAPPAMAMLAMALGNTVCHLDRFSPEAFCAAVQEYEITATFLVPTMCNRLVAMPDEFFADYDLSSLQSIIVAGAPSQQGSKERMLDIFGPTLYEFYGSTEGAINTLMRPDDHRKKPGSCGTVYPGTELKLLDDEGNEVPRGEVGELFIHNEMLVDGYYGNEEATSAAFRDGWLSVGDMARVDEDGYYFIVDRKKDMVISGGVNIYPAEVEEVLQEHPDIFEAAVIGVPDSEWGESLKAFIVPHTGATLTEEAVLAYCDAQMADYKRPRSFVFLDELPRNPSGKILKRDLRERFWAGHDSRVL